LGECRLVPPSNAEALANALGEFLTEPAGRTVERAATFRHYSETVSELERLFADTIRVHSRSTPAAAQGASSDDIHRAVIALTQT
jgi:hypothetical protein